MQPRDTGHKARLHPMWDAVIPSFIHYIAKIFRHLANHTYWQDTVQSFFVAVTLTLFGKFCTRLWSFGDFCSFGYIQGISVVEMSGIKVRALCRPL